MKHMHRFFFCRAILIWSLLSGGFGELAIAETNVLQGKIVARRDQQPLPGVIVEIAQLRIGTITDENGEFRLEIPKAGVYKMRCQLLGYRELVRTVTLESEHTMLLTLEESPIELQGVEVIEKRNRALDTPQALRVLRAAELDVWQEQTLGDMLKRVPGMTVLRTGPAIAKPVIRGLHSNRIAIYNSGIPQEGQQWGEEHAPAIDPFMPAKVEILKGAASVQYGANAIGGVIRVEPKQLSDVKDFGGKINLNVFSNSQQGAGAVLLEGPYRALPGLSWRLQGSRRKSGTARAPKYVLGNTASSEQNGTAALGYHQAAGEIELYFSHFSTQLGILSNAHIGNRTDLLEAIERGYPKTNDSFTYEILPPKQKIIHNLLSVNSKYQLAKAGWLEMKYGWQQNQRQEFDAHRRFGKLPDRPAFDLVLTTHSLENAFNHHPIHNIYGKIGMNVMRQGNVSKAVGTLVPNFRAYNWGVYWIENWSHANWSVNAGTRFGYRWMRVFLVENGEIRKNIHQYDNFSGVLGAIYQLPAAWTIAANIGTSWRPPSVNELYSNGVHHGSARIERGDPDLQTERGLNVDVTLQKNTAKTRVQVSLFNNIIQQFIFLRPKSAKTASGADSLVTETTIRGEFPVFRYEQADAVLSGVEGEFERWLGIYRLGVSASLLWGKNPNTNEALIFMPADRFKLMNYFRLPAFGALKKNSIEMTTTWVRKQNRFPVNVDYTDPPPGYVLWNINLGSQFQVGKVPLNLSVAVHNLFDRSYRDYLSRYRYFGDDPGRNILFRLQIPFGAFKTPE